MKDKKHLCYNEDKSILLCANRLKFFTPHHVTINRNRNLMAQKKLIP